MYFVRPEGPHTKIGIKQKKKQKKVDEDLKRAKELRELGKVNVKVVQVFTEVLCTVAYVKAEKKSSQNELKAFRSEHC